MKKDFPLPLVLDCDGLSSKLVEELGDELRLSFEVVDISGDEITARVPSRSDYHDDVESLIKTYDVQVIYP